MKQYAVTGMSCAACVARVEKAVKKVEGVEDCAVSLLTNSMGVEGSADPAARRSRAKRIRTRPWIFRRMRRFWRIARRPRSVGGLSRRWDSLRR